MDALKDFESVPTLISILIITRVIVESVTRKLAWNATVSTFNLVSQESSNTSQWPSK